jgi:hypothetical protein
MAKAGPLTSDFDLTARGANQYDQRDAKPVRFPGMKQTRLLHQRASLVGRTTLRTQWKIVNGNENYAFNCSCICHGCGRSMADYEPSCRWLRK